MPKNAKDAKNAKNANCFRSANAISSTTKAYSISMAEAKKGGRRWSPRGTEGGAGRAGLEEAIYAKFYQILALSSASNSDISAQILEPISFSLPRSSGTTGIQAQICAFCVFWAYLG